MESDLGARARRRLERHAADCPECSRGIRAMKALLRLIPAIAGRGGNPAPTGSFDRVRGEASASSDNRDPSAEKR